MFQLPLRHQFIGSKVVHGVAYRERELIEEGDVALSLAADAVLCKSTLPPTANGTTPDGPVTCKNCLKVIAAAENEAYEAVTRAEMVAAVELAKEIAADVAEPAFDLVQAEADADGDDWTTPAEDSLQEVIEQHAHFLRFQFTPADGARLREMQQDIREGHGMSISAHEAHYLAALEIQIDEAFDEAWGVHLQREEILTDFGLLPGPGFVHVPAQSPEAMGLFVTRGTRHEVAPEVSSELTEIIRAKRAEVDVVLDKLGHDGVPWRGMDPFDPLGPLALDEMADFFSGLDEALRSGKKNYKRLSRAAKRRKPGMARIMRLSHKAVLQAMTDPFYAPGSASAPVPGRLLAKSKVR